MDLMFQPLRKYADFQGRARRMEYWLFVLFQWIVFIAAMIVGTLVDGILGNSRGDLGYGAATLTLVGLAWLGLLAPALAVSVRRLHDSGKSGWMILLSFIPFVGGLIVIVLMLIDGTPGPNQYGPDPKGRGADTPTVADTFA